MCGISGTLTSPGEKPVQSVLLERMNHAQQHRGPDSSGLWISPARNVGFGFRRLAIVDLDAKANQPMSNEDDSLHLVFNGEIYNHAEIRRELEALRKMTPTDKWCFFRSPSRLIVLFVLPPYKSALLLF